MVETTFLVDFFVALFVDFLEPLREPLLLRMRGLCATALAVARLFCTFFATLELTLGGLTTGSRCWAGSAKTKATNKANAMKTTNLCIVASVKICDLKRQLTEASIVRTLNLYKFYRYN
jgi:hypothetical protein